MTFITDIVSTNVLESEVSAIKSMAMRSAGMHDVASLSWGLPSFRTPEYIREGVKQFLDTDLDAGKYTLLDGLPELRHQVVETHREKTGVTVDADRNIMISAGNMQGLNTLFHTMLDPGDEIILTDPCFASHIQQIKLFNGKPVYWPLEESDNWRLDIGSLPDLITDRTQAIVLVSPSNPTGRIFTRDELIQVAEIAFEHDILIVIDDPYSEYLYENADRYFNIASVEKYSEHLVYLYSFSKSYAMSGWRLSYMVMPEELKQQAMKVHDATLICAPRISQLAGLTALSHESDHMRVFSNILSKRRDLVCERLDELEAFFTYQRPEGAYYVFPRILADHTDSIKFANDMLDNAAVALTPGVAFGPSGEHHVRMAFCVDDDTINSAFDRMQAYLRR